MTDIGEKQIAIKLSEKYISRLDALAKRGNTNRRQLMVNFIKIWLEELRESNSSNFYHLAIILREIEADFKSDHSRRSEFIELINPSPERPLPIILGEDDSNYLVSCAGRCNLTRHNMMKTMIVTGIGELEILTHDKDYDFSIVTPEIKRAFGVIMARGKRAFIEGRKEKHPLKRQGYE